MMQAAASKRGAVRVLVVTPLGKGGYGGIDRLNDSIFAALAAQPELGVSVQRLVTRGNVALPFAPFVFAAALARLFWLLVGRRVDVLHIHLSIRGSAYRKCLVADIARGFGAPYVVHLHGIDFREFWESASPPLARALDRLFLKSARIVVMGAFWAKVITDQLPQTDAQIALLPNATPTPPPPAPRADADDRRTHIVFMGKLGARKGTPVLIEALVRMRDDPDWRATIAGDGEIEATRSAVAQAGLSDRVGVPGWLDLEAREATFNAADVLTLPSTAENLPMVIMEAMSRGIAVVATPVGAVPEVIEDGRNGLLTPVGDDAALAAALTRLVKAPSLRRALGAAARADIIEKYDFTSYIRRLSAIWREAAAG